VASKKDRELRLQSEEQVLEYLQERAKETSASQRVLKNRTVAATVGRERLFQDQLLDSLHEVFGQTLASPKIKVEKPRGKTGRYLNLVLSDLHYGSNLDPRELGHKYGPIEEARRTAHILKTVALYKRDHRNETELIVHILGDIIQGQLHDMRDGLPLAEQVAAAIRILVQALRYLAVQFPCGVTVYCTPGNHGRNTARHRERATNQKWDSIETMIYVALKEAARYMPNVKVVLGYEPKYDFKMFGALGMGTHGDTVINPGYPNRSIDVAGISKQVNSINNARVVGGDKPYSVFIMGHVHVGSMTHLPGGVIIITNGCLIPPDAYAKSIGIFDTACGQWVWESVEGHPVGDARFVTVDKHTDVDDSLDSIIEPFTGL
jgi:hypothetical protein